MGNWGYDSTHRGPITLVGAHLVTIREKTEQQITPTRHAHFSRQGFEVFDELSRQPHFKVLGKMAILVVI